MPGFDNLADLVDAEFAGRESMCSFRKTPAVATVSGFWYDMSMAPGNPVPNYYIGAIGAATALARSTDGGINHGNAVSPDYKMLSRLLLYPNSATGLPATFYLCDYLVFYPFIDESTTDAQPLINTVTLPRYTDGAGVQMMAICVAPHTTGGVTFNVTYTNSAGVAGRVTPDVMIGTTNVNGTIISTAPATAGCAGPFLPLQAGDTGVRSIESVSMVSGTEVGLFTLVLVRPLVTHLLREIAPSERDYPVDFPLSPRVYDDAYLNFICLPTGSLFGVSIFGIANFSWS